MADFPHKAWAQRKPAEGPVKEPAPVVPSKDKPKTEDEQSA